MSFTSRTSIFMLCWILAASCGRKSDNSSVEQPKPVLQSLSIPAQDMTFTKGEMKDGNWVMLSQNKIFPECVLSTAPIKAIGEDATKRVVLTPTIRIASMMAYVEQRIYDYQYMFLVKISADGVQAIAKGLSYRELKLFATVEDTLNLIAEKKSMTLPPFEFSTKGPLKNVTVSLCQIGIGISMQLQGIDLSMERLPN